MNERKFNPHRQIQLPLHDINVGSLLTEMTRAYMYSGVGSALVGRLIQGVLQYEEQEVANLLPEDKALLRLLKDRLHTLRADMGQAENEVYGFASAQTKRDISPKEGSG